MKNEFGTKVISLFISLCLFVPFFCGCSFSLIDEENIEAQKNGDSFTSEEAFETKSSDKITYLSLGDSIAAGYALPEYKNDGGKTKGSFASKFAEYLRADDFLDCGVTGIDTSELLSSLKTVLKDRKFSDNDVITVAVGSNDIMTPALQSIYKATGTENSDELLNKFRILAEKGNASEGIALLLSAYSVLRSDETKAMLDREIDQFEKDFVTLIDTLKNSAPDAKIYVINYYNPFRGVTLGNVDLGEAVSPYLDKMNDFVKNHDYNGKKYAVVDISDMTFDKTNVKTDFEKVFFSLDPHPNEAGHDFIFNALCKTHEK